MRNGEHCSGWYRSEPEPSGPSSLPWGFCGPCSSVDQQDSPSTTGRQPGAPCLQTHWPWPLVVGRTPLPSYRGKQEGVLWPPLDLASLNTKGSWPQPSPEKASHFKFLLIPVQVLLNVIKITKVTACNFNVLYQQILQKKSPGHPIDHLSRYNKAFQDMSFNQKDNGMNILFMMGHLVMNFF